MTEHRRESEEAMAEVKFTQLALAEWRQEGAVSNIFTGHNNYFALLSSSTEVTLGELTMEFLPKNPLPYRLTTLEVPQDKPFAPLLKPIKTSKIYDTCNVLESQEFGLDPLYMNHSGVEPVKAQPVHVEFAPFCSPHNNGLPLLTILTTYGCCQLRTRRSNSRTWQVIVDNLNRYYFNDVFPLDTHAAKTASNYTELRNQCDLYTITAFTWSDVLLLPDGSGILYTANAAGHIVAFKVQTAAAANEGTSELSVRLYCRHQTTLGRITYLKSFGGEFLLAGSVMGVVQVLRVHHPSATAAASGVLEATASASMEMYECLWSRADRMTVRQLCVQFVAELDCYLLLFAKAAHVLAYRLATTKATEGGSLSSATLYMGGGHVTGIAALSPLEYVVTTMTSGAHLLDISWSSQAKQLLLNERPLDSATALSAAQLNADHMQMLGVCTTRNRFLWLFPLRRTREYMRGSLHLTNSVFMSVCRFSGRQCVAQLRDLPPLPSMDDYRDCFVAVRLEIFNGLLAADDVALRLRLRWSDTCDDAFLQQLQLRLFCARSAVLLQRWKVGGSQRRTDVLGFLQRATHATHLLCRLERMRQLTLAGLPLSDQQRLSLRNMRAKFRLLLEELRRGAGSASAENTSAGSESIAVDDDAAATLAALPPSAPGGEDSHQQLQEATDNFIALASKQFDALSSAAIDDGEEGKAATATEQCLDCDIAIQPDAALQCPAGHCVERCCISCLQVPLFTARHCLLCGCSALLSPADVTVPSADGDGDDATAVDAAARRCPFCRFSFMPADLF